MRVRTCEKRITGKQPLGCLSAKAFPTARARPQHKLSLFLIVII